jgi:hypothetical protein
MSREEKIEMEKSVLKKSGKNGSYILKFGL